MNKVLLLGTVDKEPEVRYVDKGICVAQLTLRTTDKKLSRNETEASNQVTEFHRIVLWRELAEIVEREVHMNDTLYVEGALHYRSYTDKAGIAHHIVEVWANSLEKIE